MVKLYASWSLAVIFTVLFLMAHLQPGYAAQRDFGLQYTPPGNADRLLDDLEDFRRAGISSLMIEDVLDVRQMEAIEGAGFNVFVSVPVIFPTSWTLEQNRQELINQWGRYVDFYRHYNSVQGLSLFSFGQIHSERFHDFFRELTREIYSVTDTPLYYISSETGSYDFENLIDQKIYQVSDTSDIVRLTSFDHVGGFVYSPEDIDFDIQAFQAMLSKTSTVAGLPIFLEWDWFIHNRESGDVMETVVFAYANDPNALFANPRSQGDVASPNWLILILLIIWGSFVGHYSLMPTYRKSLLRFFDNHRFFINDVMDRHIRVGKSSMFILFQQGLVGGLFLLALTKYTLSPLGFEALLQYLGLTDTYTPSYFMIFILGFLFFILINVICTVWLFLMNSGLRHLGQAAIFQIWPQHLNMFLVTLLITLILAGRSIIAINIVAILFLAIFVGCFFYAVMDAGRYTFTRYYYYPLTIITYVLILAGFGVWVYFYTGFLDFWDLAARL